MERIIYIAGEDEMTCQVIFRLLGLYAGKALGATLVTLPARGGQLKSKLPSLVELARKNAIVVVLLDLDNDYCPPLLKQKLLSSCGELPDTFFFNIAVDEVEAWLFADRQNFAEFFCVKSELLPESCQTKLGGPRWVTELCVDYKSSLLLTHKVAVESTDERIRKGVGVMDPMEKCKGAEYNGIMTEFVKYHWDPENARMCSTSLDRFVKRIELLNELL